MVLQVRYDCLQLFFFLFNLIHFYLIISLQDLSVFFVLGFAPLQFGHQLLIVRFIFFCLIRHLLVLGLNFFISSFYLKYLRIQVFDDYSMLLGIVVLGTLQSMYLISVFAFLGLDLLGSCHLLAELRLQV